MALYMGNWGYIPTEWGGYHSIGASQYPHMGRLLKFLKFGQMLLMFGLVVGSDFFDQLFLQLCYYL